MISSSRVESRLGRGVSQGGGEEEAELEAESEREDFGSLDVLSADELPPDWDWESACETSVELCEARKVGLGDEESLPHGKMRSSSMTCC